MAAPALFVTCTTLPETHTGKYVRRLLRMLLEEEADAGMGNVQPAAPARRRARVIGPWRFYAILAAFLALRDAIAHSRRACDASPPMGPPSPLLPSPAPYPMQHRLVTTWAIPARSVDCVPSNARDGMPTVSLAPYLESLR